MTIPVPGTFDLEISFYGTGPDEIRFSNSVDAAFITEDERQLLKKMRADILGHARRNKIKQSYYEANQVIKHLDIAVPRPLQDIGTACGIAGTVVDILDERIDWLGWSTDTGDLNGLDLIFADNDLSVESGYGHVDALTTGVSFVTVGNDGFGSSRRQLVTVESSSTATVVWDYRKRRSIAGLSQSYDEKQQLVMETLYLENANIVLARNPGSRQMEVVSRDQHNIGRCFMTRLPNRCRPYQRDGRSEITNTVRYLSEAVIRTMLGMEINREFYTAPQRFILNADPADFGVTEDMTAAEKYRKGLSLAMGMMNIVPGREDTADGDPLEVVEMKAQAPTPYIDQIRAYMSALSSETGIPTSYLGFVTENPPSADSIRQLEFRLVKRSMRRHGSFGVGWRETGLLCLLARDGDADIDFIRGLKSRFADPYTPTRAATADELAKMIQVELLTPDSSVTYGRYGLDEQEQKILTQDKVTYEAKQTRRKMQDASIAAAQSAKQNGGANAGTNAQKSPPKTSTGSSQ